MRHQLRHYVWAVSLRMQTWTIIAFAVCLVIGVSASKAQAVATISGTGPFTITQNTDLAGDVNCSTVTTADCISFAAPNLRLRLKGFTITGAIATCPALVTHNGINTNLQAGAQIMGPGKVQKFRNGILATGTNNLVQEIVVIRNCDFGIEVGSNNAQIRDNIVLNTAFVGIEIVGNDNVVRANEVHGNIAIGIRSFGTGNAIEENSVTTNSSSSGGSGIALFAASANNRVDRNIVLNNRNIDIYDIGAGNGVTPNNVCESGNGAAATVCAISPTPGFLIFHVVGTGRDN